MTHSICNDDSPEVALAPATERLLRVAADLAANPRQDFGDVPAQAALDEFLRLYSDWIIAHRGMANSLETWAEQSKILVHCMVSAGTLEEAMRLHVRCATAFWGEYIETELRSEGDNIAIIFRESLEAGADGLIRAMWPLIATLSQLEFLVGGPLQGVCGRVRNPECLPRSTVALMFGNPLSYDAQEAALVVPASQLHRAVVARAADIPTFFEKFMSTTVDGNRRPPATRSLIETLIQSDKQRSSGAPADLPSIARRLGCSPATVRRRSQSWRTISSFLAGTSLPRAMQGIVGLPGLLSLMRASSQASSLGETISAKAGSLTISNMRTRHPPGSGIRIGNA